MSHIVFILRPVIIYMRSPSFSFETIFHGSLSSCQAHTLLRTVDSSLLRPGKSGLNMMLTGLKVVRLELIRQVHSA